MFLHKEQKLHDNNDATDDDDDEGMMTAVGSSLANRLACSFNSTVR